MDFTLTDEQQLLRDTAHTLLAKECPPTLVRDHLEDPSVAPKMKPFNRSMLKDTKGATKAGTEAPAK